jgi:hypothetical protein
MWPAPADRAPPLMPARIDRGTEATAERLQERHYGQRGDGSQGVGVDVEGSSKGLKPAAVGIDRRLEERPGFEWGNRRVITRGDAQANRLRARFRGQDQHAMHRAMGEWRVDGDARPSQQRCARRTLRMEGGGGGDSVPGTTRRVIGRFLQDSGEHAQPGRRFRLGREEDIHLTARACG